MSLLQYVISHIVAESSTFTGTASRSYQKSALSRYFSRFPLKLLHNPLGFFLVFFFLLIKNFCGLPSYQCFRYCSKLSIQTISLPSSLLITTFHYAHFNNFIMISKTLQVPSKQTTIILSPEIHLLEPHEVPTVTPVLTISFW